MGRKYQRKKMNKVNSYDFFNRKKTSTVLSDLDLGSINKKKAKKADKQKFNQEPSRSFKSFMKLMQNESDGFRSLPFGEVNSKFIAEDKKKRPAKRKSSENQTLTHGFDKPKKAKSSQHQNQQSNELFNKVKSKNVTASEFSDIAKAGKRKNQENDNHPRKKRIAKPKEDIDFFEKKLTKKQKRREEVRNKEREAVKLREESKQKDLEEQNYFTDRVLLHERVDRPPILKTPIEKIKTKSKFDNKRYSMESIGISNSVSSKIGKWGKQKQQKAGYGTGLTPVKPQLSDEQLSAERERVVEQYRLNKMLQTSSKARLTPVEI